MVDDFSAAEAAPFGCKYLPSSRRWVSYISCPDIVSHGSPDPHTPRPVAWKNGIQGAPRVFRDGRYPASTHHNVTMDTSSGYWFFYGAATDHHYEPFSRFDSAQPTTWSWPCAGSEGRAEISAAQLGRCLVPLRPLSSRPKSILTVDYARLLFASFFLKLIRQQQGHPGTTFLFTPIIAGSTSTDNPRFPTQRPNLHSRSIQSPSQTRWTGAQTPPSKQTTATISPRTSPAKRTRWTGSSRIQSGSSCTTRTYPGGY
jgi:hypothetical protein